MRRYGVAALAVTLMASGCATGNEVCLPAILENQSIEALALQHFMRPVGVRETGSDQAVAAWRLASYSGVYVMELPNGGCSASVDAGDPDALNDRALELLAARGTFAVGASYETRGGNAVNTAHCSPETDRPVVVGLVRKTGGRGAAFLANVFRAQNTRPPFCQA
jgi:hypothetical protein